ncbi:hypothetical protein ACFFF7_13220 [Novosphingobium aquiterrae]|uniref:Transposase n=1 Tax=Novosphingobium aquiterrae TaxID=624388 RepID=A0ABV6PKK0_9SPHN
MGFLIDAATKAVIGFQGLIMRTLQNLAEIIVRTCNNAAFMQGCR